jgi:CDP-diacylglycerol--serine O-phosphatidyltransferase
MKHLPNLLTLGNLFCGCIAIAFITSSQPYLIEINAEKYWISGTEQAVMGSLFIAIAALLDVLDGLVARSLKLFSSIGKDLDSLADLVSFGVAPSMILFKMLWVANIARPDAMDVSMLAMAPAFLVACFGALRLARFNVSISTGSTFTGMPIPAAGILIASFPLINLYTPQFGIYFRNPWVLYFIIGLVSWLMVSTITFFKLMPSKWDMKSLWPRLTLIAAAIALFPFMSFAAIPVLFVLYIVLALVYRPQTQLTA